MIQDYTWAWHLRFQICQASLWKTGSHEPVDTALLPLQSLLCRRKLFIQGGYFYSLWLPFSNDPGGVIPLPSSYHDCNGLHQSEPFTSIPPPLTRTSASLPLEPFLMQWSRSDPRPLIPRSCPEEPQHTFTPLATGTEEDSWVYEFYVPPACVTGIGYCSASWSIIRWRCSMHTLYAQYTVMTAVLYILFSRPH